MATKIIISNHKGGVGKTITAINTAYGLAKRKNKVLLVDCDPQGNATMTVGGEDPFTYPIEETLAQIFLIKGYPSFPDLAVKSPFPNLDFIPINADVYGAISQLGPSAVSRFFGFKKSYDLAPDEYDYIIFDTPPTLEGALTTNALVVADYVVIPIEAESSYALSGISNLLNLISAIKEDAETNTKILGYLLTKYDGRRNAAKTIKAAAQSAYGHKAIFQTTIPNTTTVSQSVMYNKPVCEYDSENTVCKSYTAFVAELLSRIEKA
jgi:chromosome partitioning protein